MQSKKAAKRYAKALFIIAKEKQQEDQVFSDCNSILSLLDKGEELVELIKNPTITKTIKIDLFKKIFATKINNISMDFLMLVIKKGRESTMKEIITSYTELYNVDKNIMVAKITAPKPLGSEVKNIIKQKISPNGHVKLMEKIDTNLVGGFIIKIGDLQYDASIRKKLNNVQRAFKL